MYMSIVYYIHSLHLHAETLNANDISHELMENFTSRM